MLHFTVDDQQTVNNGCVTCCCQKLSLKPGTTSKVSVGYAPWAVPIGQLHCAPSFQIEPMETCLVPTTGNMPPQVHTDAKFFTPTNAQLDGDLRSFVTDLENAVMKFRQLPLYGPKHGKLVLDQTGMFDYYPAANWNGEDRFYVSASDGVNDPVIFEVMIAIGID